MMKMCQVVIRQCEGYTQHKPEVVDYCEPFRDFLHQILKVYAQRRKYGINYNYRDLIVKVLLTFDLHAVQYSLNFVKFMGNFFRCLQPINKSEIPRRFFIKSLVLCFCLTELN